MANAADDSNGYGGGAGGKFRKRPFRKAATTPYDRPMRNTSSYISNGGSRGWISKIVDPASKLISSSAHKLFSSVFRKRLLPPREPARGSIGNDVESPENHLGDELVDDRSRFQKSDKNEGVAELELERDKKERETINNGPVTDGVSELERMLNQKTFTRSEIDHLSELLQSRIAEKSSTAQQGRFEPTPFEPEVGQYRQENVGIVCGNKGSSSELPETDLTPAVRSKFNSADIASPAEIAKAYMGSRSTALSPYTFRQRAQPVREENHALTRYQSHSPVMQTTQKPLITPMKSQNELVIPRSRGRSALYSMARTPYSRVLPTETKGLVTSNSCFTGQSVTAQKVLKRRCSVLENDIGYVGPIRRIRQKSNLSYTKSLGQASRTPLTHTTSSEVGKASILSSSKMQEDRGDRSKPISSSHVSSKSIEMGQRILQQLEKMTPPKEKSSDKKSGISGGSFCMDSHGSMHGHAYKSLETSQTTNSLNSVQSGQGNGKFMDSLDAALHIEKDSSFEKQKVRHENGHVKITEKSAVGDDARQNGIVSPLTNDGIRRGDAPSFKSNGNLLQENPSLPDSNKINGSVFPELISSSSSSLKNNTATEVSKLAENGADHSLPTSSVLNKETVSSALFPQSMTASTFSKPGIHASTISFGLSSSDKVSQPSLFSSSVVESHSQHSSSDVGNKLLESNGKSMEAVHLLRTSAFGNSSKSSLLGATSAATPSLANGGFQFGSSTTNSELLASSQNSSSQPIFGDQVLPSNAASASTTESQPAASPFSVSFGSSSVDSSSASFGLSSTLVSSSSGFSGLPASNSTNNGSANIFGGNNQTTSSPVFGSAFNNSSSGPSFGASSGSMPSSSAPTSSISTPPNGSQPSISFGGSSTTAPAVFAFGASPSPAQPSFGNGSSVTAFGSSLTQTKVEDTMFEDSMQSSPTGFPKPPAPASSVASPFQFSSHENHTPASPVPSPFQFTSPQTQAPQPMPVANPFQFSGQQSQAPPSSGANPFQFSSQQTQAPASSGANPFQFSSQQNQAPSSSGANPFQFSSQQNQAPASSEANPFQFSSQPNQAQASPFQFSSQQNQVPPLQNPFQASGSSGGGSFSLGTGGNDKSGRRIIKVRNRMRKK